MRILITGGCGFVGTNLAVSALERGYEVVIFDNMSRNGSCLNLKFLRQSGNIAFVHGDIRSLPDISRIVETVRPDAVFHLAGQVAMTTSIENPLHDFSVNALGSVNLLESLRKFSPNATLIYSSSNKVYGDLEQYNYCETATRYICEEFPKGFDERVSLDFRSPYGCSKGAADQCILDYYRIFGLKTVVFRHSSMYGGRQFATEDQGWVGWFCSKACEIKRGILHESLTISGSGKQVRDLLHVDDVANLYFNAVEHIEDAKGNAFNIGGGVDNSLSLLELFSFLGDHYGIKIDYRCKKVRCSDQKVFIADIEKAKRVLKWKPKIDKQEGLLNMIEWVETNCD